jgi:UDP:flavonoid glycosyltransferase YjiC (YdhE family)
VNVCVATYGSRGDVQPIIALCLALRSEGHRVLLAAPPENRKWVRSYGLSFVPLGDPFMDFAERHPDVHSPLTAPPFFRFLRAQARRQFVQLPEIVRGADLVLGCSLTFALPSVAEALSVPYRYVVFCPQVFPSAAHPSLFSRNHRMPALVNRLTWRVDALADRLLFRPLLDRNREKLGLGAISGTTIDHLLGDRPLLAAESILAPLPADLRLPVLRIGYPRLAGGEGLSRPLERFLDEGPAPVYFGFGSMPYSNRAKILSGVRASARRAHVRLVISWGQEARVGEDGYLVGPVNHERLFRKTAMVIHHGGAGTTTTAARAGVPQILAPHILDQFYWARRVQDLGLGPAPLDRRRLRVAQIAGRIRAVAADDRYRQRARETADRLARESDADAGLTAWAAVS